MLLENVRGHLSLGWDTVLCDLHALGYDVRWTLLRAADVGAAHNRARLFAVAADRDAHHWDAPTSWPVARITDETLNAPHDGLFGAHPLPLAENGHVPMWPAGLMIGGVVWEQDALLGTAQYELFPTPATTDAKDARNSTAGRKAGSQHHSGDTLSDLIYDGRLKPSAGTLEAVTATSGMLAVTATSRWGRYAAAVARCEALTRPAPDPALPSGKGGAHRLSPLFVEFLMMLPAGWVTDPALWTHLTASAARNAQLKLLGNGCVTAQAAAAWRHLTADLHAV